MCVWVFEWLNVWVYVSVCICESVAIDPSFHAGSFETQFLSPYQKTFFFSLHMCIFVVILFFFKHFWPEIDKIYLFEGNMLFIGKV